MVARAAGKFIWVIIGSNLILSVAAGAQTPYSTPQTACAFDRSEIERISAQIAATPIWNYSQISKARETLERLKSSRIAIGRLQRRLNGEAASAAVAENLDSPGEARFWSRDASELRSEIDRELRQAKTRAAQLGVSCPGCAFSVLVTKVQTAIDEAVSAPMRVRQERQTLAAYQQNMVS